MHIYIYIYIYQIISFFSVVARDFIIIYHHSYIILVCTNKFSSRTPTPSPPYPHPPDEESSIFDSNIQVNQLAILVQVVAQIKNGTAISSRQLLPESQTKHLVLNNFLSSSSKRKSSTKLAKAERIAKKKKNEKKKKIE